MKTDFLVERICFKKWLTDLQLILKTFAMIVVVLSITLVFWVLVKQLKRFYHFESYVKNLNSLYPVVPLFGSAYSLMGKSSTQVCNDFVAFSKANETPVKLYLGTDLIVVVDEPEDMKTILMSQHCLDRPFALDFLPVPGGIVTIRCLYFQWTSFAISFWNVFMTDFIVYFSPFFTVFSNCCMETDTKTSECILQSNSFTIIHSDYQ